MSVFSERHPQPQLVAEDVLRAKALDLLRGLDEPTQVTIAQLFSQMIKAPVHQTEAVVGEPLLKPNNQTDGVAKKGSNWVIIILKAVTTVCYFMRSVIVC